MGMDVCHVSLVVVAERCAIMSWRMSHRVESVSMIPSCTLPPIHCLLVVWELLAWAATMANTPS